jgi:hypothetical protein
LISVLEDFSYSSRIIPGSSIAWNGFFFDLMTCRYPDEVGNGEVEGLPCPSESR